MAFGRRLAGVLASLAALVGCGGDGVLKDGSIVPPSGGVTFASLQDAVFTPRCALPGCHAGPGAPLGLDLSKGQAYGCLVGVASVELPSFQRVAPGRSADSYVVMKLSGDPRIAGERMPFGGPYLDLATVDEIRKWIDAGAAGP